MKVAEFFSVSGTWDEVLLRNNFSHHIVEAILDIPLNRGGCPDSRFWLGGRNGKY